MKNYGWGSENLRREISYISIGSNKAVIEFWNGSWIKVVTAADTGRGNRANVLVIDEFRMVDRDTIKTVLKRFLGSPRQPNYLSLKEYSNDDKWLEDNMEIYMSSAWYKSHWSYEKFKAFFVNLMGGRDGYFVCGLPYQIAVKEGLKKRSEIEDEMSEMDFDKTTFDIEMGCMPFGSTDGAFFGFEDIDKCRKLADAVYPATYFSGYKLQKIPELLPNERRILSVDIALMASIKTKNDASAIFINRAIPSNKNSYMANIVYIETHDEGLTTEELALIVRRLFAEFKCTDLVVDTAGQGLGVYDALIKDMIDPKTGVLYPALNCCNDKAMEVRCKVPDAPKVIWSIKAVPAFNNEICLLLRSGFQSGKLNLLVSDFESEEILKDRIKDFHKLTAYEQLQYEMPYKQTTLTIYELINLEYEVKGANIRIFEKSGMRKDRYSSLAYNYWVQCQLERDELNKPKSGADLHEYARRLRLLNKRPNTY